MLLAQSMVQNQNVCFLGSFHINQISITSKFLKTRSMLKSLSSELSVYCLYFQMQLIAEEYKSGASKSFSAVGHIYITGSYVSQTMLQKNLTRLDYIFLLLEINAFNMDFPAFFTF